MIQDIAEALRDFVWGLLPRRMVPKIASNQFAFVCHPIDERDAARKYSFAQGIGEGLFHFWTRNFWPVLGAEIKGGMSDQEIAVKGWAVIQPVPPALMVRDPELGRKKIIKSVKFCERLGFKLVALGGYNSIITHDGQDLVGEVDICVTTGNTYSVLLTIQNLEEIARKLSLDLWKMKIGIVGAAGSVGSACAKIIPKMAGEVYLMDNNRKAIRELCHELQKDHGNVTTFEDLSTLKQMNIVITATSTPKAIIQDQHVKAGQIFIDAAQPKNISEDIPVKRNDVIVIDSGIAEIPWMGCAMTMGPYQNEVYACLGEAMVLAWHNKFENYSIGKVQVEKVDELASMVKQTGFKVAKFRNCAGYISDGDIAKFKEKFVTCHL